MTTHTKTHNEAELRAEGWAAAVAALRDPSVDVLVAEPVTDPKDPFTKAKRFLAPHDRETAALYLEVILSKERTEP